MNASHHAEIENARALRGAPAPPRNASTDRRRYLGRRAGPLSSAEVVQHRCDRRQLHLFRESERVAAVGLIYRRATSDRVRRTTSRMDIFTYVLLTALIVMGAVMTFRYTLFASDPVNYRVSIAVWWRSLFWLHPNVAAATAAPALYQVHAIIAWLFWATFPFSRLVHAWSIPLQYIGRPYILYRRRFRTAS